MCPTNNLRSLLISFLIRAGIRCFNSHSASLWQALSWDFPLFGFGVPGIYVYLLLLPGATKTPSRFIYGRIRYFSLSFCSALFRLYCLRLFASYFVVVVTDVVVVVVVVVVVPFNSSIH